MVFLKLRSDAIQECFSVSEQFIAELMFDSLTFSVPIALRHIQSMLYGFKTIDNKSRPNSSSFFPPNRFIDFNCCWLRQPLIFPTTTLPKHPGCCNIVLALLISPAISVCKSSGWLNPSMNKFRRFLAHHCFRPSLRFGIEMTF